MNAVRDKKGTIGSTEQEGGDTTEDRNADEQNTEFISGNRQRTTTGATPETRKAEERLDEAAANLGSEIRRANE